MNNKVMGLALIVFGIILFVWGFNMSSAADIKATTNIPPLSSWVGMIVGGINVFVGILKLNSKA